MAAAMCLAVCGCTLWQPGHLTVHVVDGEPSAQAQADSGGNTRAALSASADIAKTAIPVLAGCPWCLVLERAMGVLQTAAGVTADAVEGQDVVVTRVALPLDGRGAVVQVPTRRGTIVVIVLARQATEPAPPAGQLAEPWIVPWGIAE